MLSDNHLDPLVGGVFWMIFFSFGFMGRKPYLNCLNFVNSYYPRIKYTWEWSTERFSYLDVMISVKDGRILTDVYSKLTDTHKYLHYGSCHPAHVKKGILYGQALRTKRICSTKKTYNRKIEMLRENLEKRGFNKGFFYSQSYKTKGISRDNLLCQEKRKRKKREMTSLVMTFHPVLSGVGKIVDSLWSILQASGGTAKIFNKKLKIMYGGLEI